MIKNLTGGTVINYGPDFPADLATFDGTLYYKTAGAQQGLYIFGFNQDPSQQNQTLQNWTEVKSEGLYVQTTGGSMSGDLRQTTPTVSIFSNNYRTMDGGLMKFVTNGDTTWETEAGDIRMQLSSLGLSINGFAVVHAGNSAGVSVGQLDGRQASYYLDFANMAGTIDWSKTAFTPVRQGVPGQTTPIEIRIGYLNSKLNYSLDGAAPSSVWPMTAATANSVEWTNVAGRPSNLTGLLSTGVWSTSSDSQNRFFFDAAGASRYNAPVAHIFSSNMGATTTMTIDAVGNVVATGDVTAFSDRRVKKDIQTIENALEKVKSLTGITFTRIDSGERGTGLIAQDVQAVLPEAVHEQVFDGMLSVAYGNLVGLLVESVKELSGQVEALKAEIAALK